MQEYYHNYYLETRKQKQEYNRKKAREWYTKNKERANASARAYRNANPERVREIKRAHYLANKKKHNAQGREWHAAHKKEANARSHAWYLAHKTEVNEYWNTRYHTNVQYKLAQLLRNRLNKALKRNTRHGSAIKDLGCTIAELKIHLESQFTEGMTWGSHGNTPKSWSIDHIRPFYEFDLRDPEQVKEACNWRNLRPMWLLENITRPHPRYGKTPKAA